MPAAFDESVCDQRVGAWLARGDIERCETLQESLTSVIDAIGQPACEDGHAALRFWGQDGERPTGWMAAADPIHMEARLDHLRLHHLWSDEWQEQELRELLDELQTELAQDENIEFSLVESCGYLRGDAPMLTALHSPAVVNGCDPIALLPSGADAAQYQRLLSEIQMTLHQSVINQRREDRNLRVINSLWIWGGGSVSEAVERKLPPLYADDAIFHGYWLSSRRECQSWPGNLNSCVEMSPSGFVAVTPEQPATAEEYAESLTAYLHELRQLLKNSALRGMTLIFRQGLTVRIRPRQIFRIWRREIPKLVRSVDS